MTQEVELLISEIARGESSSTLGVFDGTIDFEVTVPVWYSDNEVLAEIMRVRDIMVRGEGILG